MSYEKAFGRLKVSVSPCGAMNHDFIGGCTIASRIGHSDRMESITLSIEEMRDLQYCLGRALARSEVGQ